MSHLLIQRDNILATVNKAFNSFFFTEVSLVIAKRGRRVDYSLWYRILGNLPTLSTTHWKFLLTLPPYHSQWILQDYQYKNQGLWCKKYHYEKRKTKKWHMFRMEKFVCQRFFWLVNCLQVDIIKGYYGINTIPPSKVLLFAIDYCQWTTEVIDWEIRWHYFSRRFHSLKKIPKL